MSKIQLNTDYYYDDFKNNVKTFEEKYFPLLKKEIIGVSHDNREIVMIKIGYGKKNIICTGSVHGRESVNPIVLMKIIESYCEAYINNEVKNGFQFHSLLNRFSIYFIPLLNPDGYMISLKGFNEIQNIKLKEYIQDIGIPHQEWKFNARGIDLNRNFPSTTFRAKDQYDYCASENETKALINVFLRIPSIGFVDYHSRGKEIYYNRSAMSNEYNVRQLEIAKILMNLTGYHLIAIKDEILVGDTGGNTVHYFSEYIQEPAITIETVSEEEGFPLNKDTQMETFEEIQYTLIGFGKYLTDQFSLK